MSIERDTYPEVVAAFDAALNATTDSVEERRKLMVELCYAVRQDERLRCETEVLKSIGAQGRRYFRDTIKEAING